jgi:aminoglycoside/choline kinase family phosphotransferase
MMPNRSPWVSAPSRPHSAIPNTGRDVPDVLAAEPDQGWLLMRDFGGQPLGDLRDLAVWQQALTDWATIQRALAGDTARLFTLGCPDYRLETIFGDLAALLDRDDLILLDRDDGLSADEVAQLRAQLPQLKADIAQLADYAVPASLVHCDFHPWNIQVNEGRIVYFDWADGCVSHPFFDLLRFLPIVERDFPDQPGAVDQLRDAYLDCWTDFADMAALREACTLAERLNNVQQAVYYGDLVDGIEASARWELEDWPLRFLKALLGE